MADKPGRGESGETEDVLARWSRRKLQARSGDVDPGQEQTAAQSQPRESNMTGAESAPQLTDTDMPPLESLTEDSDYTPFLSPGVSDGLRRLALRKLFSQQAFNATDGLNDYDGDYTQFAGLGKVVTREMQRRLKRELETRLAREQPQPDDITAPQSGEAAAGAIPPGDVAAGHSDGESVTAAGDSPQSADDGAEDKDT